MNHGRLLQLPANALGIVCVIGAMASFTTQDAMIKSLSGGYPLHEIVFSRAVLAAILTLWVMRYEGGLRQLRTRRPMLHIGRGLLLVVANSSFFLALAAMPIAEASAVFFVAPLLIILMSALVLGEAVGPRRWAAVLIGLVGVMVMLRPGADAFRPVALLPLVAAASYAGVQTITRRLGATDRASVMAFYVQLTFIAVSAAIGLGAGDGRFAPGDNASLDFLLRAWTWPRGADAVLFVVIGVLSAIGAYLMSQGYRVATAAVVTPFEYVALPLALFWGIVLFGDWPDGVAMLGIGLIFGSGLYVAYREFSLFRARAPAAD